MSFAKKAFHRIHRGHLIVIFSVLAYLFVVYRNAWLGDDAFITMRTVDNFVNTFRPIWNPGERVQTFTHPLWFLVLSSAYSVFQDPYFTLFFVSIFVSGITASILLMRNSSNMSMLMTSLALLISSKAFVDYSTSGPENPLSHLLLLAFILVFFHQKFLPEKRTFLLALFAGLAALNRLDTILIYLPALVYNSQNSTLSKKKRIQIAFLGVVPLILWIVFATFYYGFPLPNTYYAKLHTGIPLSETFRQGGYYFANSFSLDPVTLTAILIVF